MRCCRSGILHPRASLHGADREERFQATLSTAPWGTQYRALGGNWCPVPIRPRTKQGLPLVPTASTSPRTALGTK